MDIENGIADNFTEDQSRLTGYKDPVPIEDVDLLSATRKIGRREVEILAKDKEFTSCEELGEFVGEMATVSKDQRLIFEMSEQLLAELIDS
jgi:hypothetical protein